MSPTEKKGWIWPLSLERIEATVAVHLGPGRVAGNEQGPCFSRQISMYLANRVAGWSTPRIGKFYNGRHHTTVLHAIEKVEYLRKADESIEALLDVLIAALSPGPEVRLSKPSELGRSNLFIEAVTARVLDRILGQVGEEDMQRLLTNSLGQRDNGS